MHWSRPAALRTLAALRRHSWSATTREIASCTRSLAVHSDIASVRCLLAEDGLRDADLAISCTYGGTSHAGRRVYIYTLAPWARIFARRLLDSDPVQMVMF